MFVVTIEAEREAIVEERHVKTGVELIGLLPTQVGVGQCEHLCRVFSIISVYALLAEEEVRRLVVDHVARLTKGSAETEVAHHVIAAECQLFEVEHTRSRPHGQELLVAARAELVRSVETRVGTERQQAAVRIRENGVTAETMRLVGLDRRRVARQPLRVVGELLHLFGRHVHIFSPRSL